MIQDNSPALGWLRITNAVVTYRNKLYFIPDDCTVKKYIYWDAERPDRFFYTNQILEETAEKFLVLINDDGQGTICHSKKDYFQIKFDSESNSTIEQKIHGLYNEFKDENGKITKEFSNILQQNHQITQTVGKIEETQGKLSEKTSQIHQMSETIRLSVENTKKEFKETEFSKKLVATYASVTSNYGMLGNILKGALSDDKLNESEIQNINKVKKICDDSYELLSNLWDTLPDNSEIFGKSINEISNIVYTYKNEVYPIKRGLDGILQDILRKKTSTSVDYVNILMRCGGIVTKTSLQRKALLGMLSNANGGKTVDILGQLIIDSQASGFHFEQRINDIITKISDFKVSQDEISGRIENIQGNYSKISQTVDNITNEVFDKKNGNGSVIKQLKNQISQTVTKNGLKSFIEQNPNSIKIAFNKIDSSSAEFTEEGLEIKKGYISTDMLIPPTNGSNAIIHLYDTRDNKYESKGGKPSIDATEAYNTGTGLAIRLKWNDGNYYKIGSNRAAITLNGSEQFTLEKIDYQYTAKIGDNRVHDRRSIFLKNEGGQYGSGYSLIVPDWDGNMYKIRFGVNNRKPKINIERLPHGMYWYTGEDEYTGGDKMFDDWLI